MKRLATGKLIIPIFALCCVLILMSSAAMLMGEEISLKEAVEIAVGQTARGGMIEANLEVAEQNYFARKINFYVPEIYVRGSVPAYNVDESYRFFGGADQKQLYKTRDLGFNSYIELNQNLITGGDVIITANLLARQDRYPNTRFDAPEGTFIDEVTRRGFFAFSYTQPLLKPSDSKHNLNNTRDDYEIARMRKIEEKTSLSKEVTETYMNLLQLSIKNELYSSKYESARLQSVVDSLKFLDEVISEEDWLLSTSARLDAELDKVEIETETDETRRALAILLDRDVTEKFDLREPKLVGHIDSISKQRMFESWDQSVPVKKANHEYLKAQREADYQASGHGLTGDLTASYSTGRGYVETDDVRNDINTKGWGVSLNFSYPLWDGGSSGASVKAARILAEQSRLEYNQARQNTRAEIFNLINQLDVSYKRLGIMEKQIELAYNRLQIAEGRMADGQISEITYLESKVFYLETKDRYLEELKSYLLNKIDLEGKFAGE
jgi:outer membrane protein TolC